MTGLLADRLVLHAAERPDGSAIRSLGASWTWSALATSAGIVREALARAKTPAQSFVLIVADHSPLVPIAMLGASAHGAVPAIVDGREPAFVAAATAALSPAAVILTGRRAEIAAGCAVISTRLEGSNIVIETIGGDSHEAASAPGGSGLVVFSSGTTAAPKAIVWSESRLRALYVTSPPADGQHGGSVGLVRSLGFAGDVLLAAALLAGGAPISVIGPMFAAAPAFAAMSDLGVARVTCTPTQLELMLNSGATLPPSLRAIRVTGAPVPAETLHRLHELAGAVVVSKSYGLGETGVVSVLGPDEVRARPESSGRVIAGRSVTVERDDGSRAEAGETGTLVIRLAQHEAADGYWPRRSPLAAAFRDGVVRPGDMGFIDAEGYLTVTGRPSELLKVAGQSVSARHIEHELGRESGRSGFAAVGVPDARDGECAAVVYVPSDEPDEAEKLRQAAVRALAGAAVPRWFLPRRRLAITGAHKLDRRGLAAEASRYTTAWREVLARDGRLWPARFVADDPASSALLVDGFPAACSVPVAPGARKLALVEVAQPQGRLGWAVIADGVDERSSGVRVLTVGGLESVAERLAIAAVHTMCDAALRLPGPTPAFVVSAPRRPGGLDLLLRAGFAPLAGAPSLLGWSPSGEAAAALLSSDSEEWRHRVASIAAALALRKVEPA